MKPEIHPEYKEIKVACSCGNNFVTGSTIGHDLHIEICAKCHPFYTGTQKLIDTAGRVDRFRQKYAQNNKAVASKAESVANKTAASASKVEAKTGKAEAKTTKAKGKTKAKASKGEDKQKSE